MVVACRGRGRTTKVKANNTSLKLYASATSKPLYHKGTNKNKGTTTQTRWLQLQTPHSLLFLQALILSILISVLEAEGSMGALDSDESWSFRRKACGLLSPVPAFRPSPSLKKRNWASNRASNRRERVGEMGGGHAFFSQTAGIALITGPLCTQAVLWPKRPLTGLTSIHTADHRSIIGDGRELFLRYFIWFTELLRRGGTLHA